MVMMMKVTIIKIESHTNGNDDDSDDGDDSPEISQRACRQHKTQGIVMMMIMITTLVKEW